MQRLRRKAPRSGQGPARMARSRRDQRQWAPPWAAARCGQPRPLSPGHIGRALSTQRSVPAGRRRCQAAAARRAAMRGRRTPPVAGRAAPASLRGGSQQPAVPRCSRPCNRVAACSAHKHAPRGLLAASAPLCRARFSRRRRVHRAGLRRPQTGGLRRACCTHKHAVRGEGRQLARLQMTGF